MVDPVAVAGLLAEELPAIVELTGRLVAVDSPTDDAAGVARVAEVVAGALAGSGARVERRPLPGCGPLLDAGLDLGPGPTVLVLGHADTVWPAGTAADWPFRGVGDRLEGPGVGDMKCCLATAVAVLRLLERLRPPGLGTIRLLVVPDEERGSTASRGLIEAAAREAVACLVLEAARPDGGVVTGRGAVGAMRVTATGVARHVTDPGQPASALAPLAALVGPIEALGASVGVLRGGTARQVVPGAAELLVDLRAPTTAAAEELAAAVHGLVADVPRAPGVTLAVAGGVTRPAFPRGPGSLALYALAGAAAAALGAPLPEVVERGGSDASFPGALGRPTLDGLGPVCHGSCSPAEWVEASSIPVRGAILAAVLAGAPTATLPT